MKYKAYDECHTIGYFKTINDCVVALFNWNNEEEIKEIIKNLNMTKDFIEIETDNDIYYIERIR